MESVQTSQLPPGRGLILRKQALHVTRSKRVDTITSALSLSWQRVRCPYRAAKSVHLVLRLLVEGKDSSSPKSETQLRCCKGFVHRCITRAPFAAASFDEVKELGFCIELRASWLRSGSSLSACNSWRAPWLRAACMSKLLCRWAYSSHRDAPEDGLVSRLDVSIVAHR